MWRCGCGRRSRSGSEFEGSPRFRQSSYGLVASGRSVSCSVTSASSRVRWGSATSARALGDIAEVSRLGAPESLRCGSVAAVVGSRMARGARSGSSPRLRWGVHSRMDRTLVVGCAHGSISSRTCSRCSASSGQSAAKAARATPDRCSGGRWRSARSASSCSVSTPSKKRQRSRAAAASTGPPIPTAWSIVPDPRRRDPLRDPAQGEEHVREHVSMEQVA